MAALIDVQTQTNVLLQSHHSFGRLKSAVNTYVSEPYVSKVHTFIEWNGEYWIIRDVSSNGTWLNGKKLAGDHIAKLHEGDAINLGSKSGYGLNVADLKPPCDCLIPVDHISDAIELEYFHLLPYQKSHQMVLSYDNNTYSWWQEILAESFDEPLKKFELNDQEYLDIDGKTWQLQINRTLDDTVQLRPSVTSLDQLSFIFQTSLDEETTQVFIQSGEQQTDLLVRSHHYLTLTLARQRIKDINAGADESEQGWIYAELLAKGLGMDACHLNIQIYRIRKQFVDALNNSCESNNIIERKGGKLRLASTAIRIVKGDEIEFDNTQFEALQVHE